MAKAGCPQSGCTDTVRVNGRLSAGRLVNVVIPVVEPSGGVPADKVATSIIHTFCKTIHNII